MNWCGAGLSGLTSKWVQVKQVPMARMDNHLSKTSRQSYLQHQQALRCYILQLMSMSPSCSPCLPWTCVCAPCVSMPPRVSFSPAVSVPPALFMPPAVSVAVGVSAVVALCAWWCVCGCCPLCLVLCLRLLSSVPGGVCVVVALCASCFVLPCLWRLLSVPGAVSVAVALCAWCCVCGCCPLCLVLCLCL